MSDVTYREHFRMLGLDDLPPAPQDRWGWTCSVCDADVTDTPCPVHAPNDVPGLTLIDCDATPRHWLWTLSREDYGTPCFWCERDEYARLEFESRACKHGPWYRWRVKWWLYRWLFSPLRLQTGFSWESGNAHRGCQKWHWRWSR